jgi:putative DNA primase/helicase
VAVAFNAGNLLPVAQALRKKYQDTDIVICADDDRRTDGNLGVTKAREAAAAIHAQLAIPGFPSEAGGTDFNDLAIEAGLDAVSQQILAVVDRGIPPNFKLTKDMLYLLRERTSKGQVKVEEIAICSRLEVLALTRNTTGGEWGRLLRFADQDRGIHEWAMPTEMLAGDGSEYRARLLEQGLTIWPSREAHYGLHEYISQCRPAGRARAVTRVGWHGNAFVLPDEVFGDTQGERTLYQSAIAIDHKLNQRGSLQDWQREIAIRCLSNSRLIFAVSAAFVPPLLYLTGDESGGFNYVGQSSLGKTTALRVAGSVWGGSQEPAGYLRQWRATSNGLEGIAALHSDTSLCLDELSEVSAREAGSAAYMLANGQGKGRMRPDISLRRAHAWRISFLSSGELTLADKVQEDDRKRATAGQQVRVLDIPSDAGSGLGLFENLHGSANGQEFADWLRASTQRYYGVPAREFLAEIVKDSARVADATRQSRDDFIRDVCPRDADGQVRRAATRFGLVAAAGELATALGVTGWERGSASWAAGVCFGAWLTHVVI